MAMDDVKIECQTNDFINRRQPLNIGDKWNQTKCLKYNIDIKLENNVECDKKQQQQQAPDIKVEENGKNPLMKIEILDEKIQSNDKQNELALSGETKQPIKILTKPNKLDKKPEIIIKNVLKCQKSSKTSLVKISGTTAAVTSSRLLCTICLKTFANKTTLRRHKCKPIIVGRTNVKKRKRKLIHQMKPSKQMDLIEKVMDKNEITKDVDVKDGKEDEKEKQYDCEWCSETYQSIAKLQSHTLLIHSKPYACQSCPKSFSNYYFYQIHTTIHNDIKNPLCNVCMRRFTNIERLQAHMLTHLREKPHVCPVCSKGFLQSIDLTQHRKLCRPVARKTYNCKLCSQPFINIVQLMTHLRKHCAENATKPYICSLCLTPFWYSRYFVRHMLVHSGFKPFICDLCKTNYGTRKALVRHMRRHIRNATLHQ